MIEIKIIDPEHKRDICIPNEPFEVWGQIIPSYENGVWRYSVKEFAPEDRESMCFPDENYDYDSLCADRVFVGAYDGDKCIGLAILADAMFKYLYLEDLKVCRAYRRRGVGKALIAAARKIARERGYNGVYTIGQDNNLSACLFYLGVGFVIGGFDNRVYRGTSQEGKADIIFYLDN